MKVQNTKRLYKILVDTIIKKEFTKDEVNDILSELHIKEITWERIRKEINKQNEKEDKKRKFEEEWEERKKEEDRKLKEKWRKNAMEMKRHSTPP